MVIAKPIAGYSVETNRRGDAGTIGVALLSRFNLVFDYGRHRLIMEATATARRPMAYDASGLLVAGSGPDYRGIVVVSVDPDSPAAAASIRPGDSLLMIDGTGVAELGLTGIRARLTQPGMVNMRVVHRGVSRDVVLRLRERL
jgi:S1-C subfamily serine protease